MISTRCNIQEFFNKINGMNHEEAIDLAHQEATAAERCLLSQRISDYANDSRPLNCINYSKTLKEFISYLRYSVKPKISDDVKYRLFHSYVKHQAKRMHY
jgi:hypothetical protein